MDNVGEHGSSGQLSPEETARFLALFEAQSVAVVGVSTSVVKWGFRVLFNTIEAGYTGRLYGVNPKHDTVLDIPCFPTVSDLPEPVDLAVIALPTTAVRNILRECAAKGVKAVIVITAGFSELDTERADALQNEITEIARETGILLVGPNCAGIIGKEPHNLCCGMPPLCPEPGGLAMSSQSGNIGLTAIRWAELHQVGVSRYVSTGNEAATTTEDFLRFFADDPRTKAILSYIEGVPDGRRLFEAMKYAARRKPVVLVKGGRSNAGMKAAKSHTGSLAAPMNLFSAACRQAGVCLVDDVYEAVQLAATFVCQPLPRGRRVGIATRGGGWGVIAADACVEAGLDVVDLPEDTLEELDSFLPEWWNRGNPVDMVAGLDVPTALARAAEVLIKCPVVDTVIVLSIGYMSGPARWFEGSDRATQLGLDKLNELAKAVELENARIMGGLYDKYRKPVVTASDMVITAYGATPNVGITELEQFGIYTSPDPLHVARIVAHMADRHEFLNGTPRTAWNQ